MMRLREALDGVPDHRSSQGRRHPLGAVLSLAVWAMLCGARSLYAIAQWGRDHRAAAGQALGFPLGRTPCAATLHRVFKDLDVAAFEEVLREWVQDSGVDLGLVVSVDGKTPVSSTGQALRGIHGEEIPGVHLVSAYAAGSGAVLTQVATSGQGSGIGGGQGGVGADSPGREDSGGGRTADPTGGVPADCSWRRGLPVAGERESAGFAWGPGGNIFPLWKLKGAAARPCPGGRLGNGGREGPR